MVDLENDSNAIQIPVLVIGGGITGLSAALFLHQQGVPFLLVERHTTTAIQPKSRSIDVRAMELFRELGLNHSLREAGKAMAPAWGILQGQNLVDALDHRASDAKAPPGGLGGLAQLQGWAAQSPESICRCTQDISEAVLFETAIERGGDLRFNHELIRFSQTEPHVRALIRNRQTGQELVVVAQYMIAADGANSPIRNQLQVATTGVGTLANFLNIYFEADLAELVKGREFSQFLVREPEVTGYLLSINNQNRWAFHLTFHPEKGEAVSDYPESRLVALLKRLIGLPDLTIRILSVLPWPLAVRVAEELQFDRIFLAGDAAHTMTPYAGKGANAGVQDSHNLAWKLGAVVRGEANEKLLATYQDERQPVGAFYAHLSGEMAAPDGLIDVHKLVDQSANLLGLPTYHYTSLAIVGGLATEQEVTYFTGQPGTRLPHLWLDEPNEQSTLDWLTGGFVLVASGQTNHWSILVPPLTRASGLRVVVKGFAREADQQSWQQLTCTSADDALLVRPDGFVAARLLATMSVNEAAQILRKILAKSA